MPTQHKVAPGDCIASIAFRYGFAPDTLWNAPENADLKAARKNPNILLAGDVVVIPDKMLKLESRATDASHRFRRQGVPEKLRLRFAIVGMPRKNEPYTLEIDGHVVSEGARTGADGEIEHSIAPNAQRAKVTFPETGEELLFNLGHIDPMDTPAGVKGRLRSLGFYDGPIDDQRTEELRSALGRFQLLHGLTVNGDLDGPTRDKLEEEYGG